MCLVQKRGIRCLFMRWLRDRYSCNVWKIVFSHVLFWGHWYPVLDFWWRLLWVSKPEWVLPYSHCGGKCNVHFLRSTSGATRCRPLDGQHCGVSTGFIYCPKILLCGTSESRTRDQQMYRRLLGQEAYLDISPYDCIRSEYPKLKDCVTSTARFRCIIDYIRLRGRFRWFCTNITLC